MTPYAIYVEERAVHVQWEPRGEYVTLHEDGSVTTRFREPPGDLLLLDGTVSAVRDDWQAGYKCPR